jgi:hypothetical protein
MMTISSPPTTRPFGNLTRVPSGRKPRPASLYGDEMRYAWCTPGSTWNSVTSKCEGVPTPARMVCMFARRAMHVEAELHHPLDHVLYLVIRCPVLHGYDHHCCPLLPSKICITKSKAFISFQPDAAALA